MGIASDIKPRSHEKQKQWLFVHYLETPSERADGCWLDALYFRDTERKHFGKLEFVGALSRRDWRSVATKILKDNSYRLSLLSDDPDLRAFWKKR